MVRHSGTWFAFPADSHAAFVVPNLSGITLWMPNNCSISCKSALASPEDGWDSPVASTEEESRQIFWNCHPPAALNSLICKLPLSREPKQQCVIKLSIWHGHLTNCLQTNPTLVNKYIYRNINAFSDHLWKRKGISCEWSIIQRRNAFQSLFWP